jgi:hypothetical protein
LISTNKLDFRHGPLRKVKKFDLVHLVEVVIN